MKRIHSEKPTLNLAPSAVLVGSTKSGRVAAAWFDDMEASQAVSTAPECGFHVLQLANDEHKRLAAKLPHGRLRKDGKPYVSRVSASASDALAQLKLLTSKPVEDPTMTDQPDLEKTNTTTAGVQSTLDARLSDRLPGTLATVAPVQLRPQDFDEVGPGSLVLARDDESEGWYEAIVVLAQSDHFWLRWRDYPRERQIQRKRSQLALLYPKAG